MACQVLHYNCDMIVNEIVLGILLTINLSCQYSPIKMGFATFLVEMMHDPLNNFSSTNFFRYQSYLLYMIVYHNKLFFDQTDLKNPIARP